MDIAHTTTSALLPSFTLYPINTKQMKTCLESPLQKLICNLNGPRFDKKQAQDNEPTFNVTITDCSNFLTKEQLNLLSCKINEIMVSMVLRSRYNRTVFDLHLEILQYNTANPVAFLLSPICNLVCYTAALKGIEINALFSCCSIWMADNKFYSQQVKGVDCSWMTLCLQHRDRKAVFLQFEGQFNYQGYERLNGWLHDANNEIEGFLQKKIIETYGLFNVVD